MSLVIPAIDARLQSVLIAPDFSEESEKPPCSYHCSPLRSEVVPWFAYHASGIVASAAAGTAFSVVSQPWTASVSQLLTPRLARFGLAPLQRT